jgi:hypothetical protein
MVISGEEHEQMPEPVRERLRALKDEQFIVDNADDFDRSKIDT